LKAKADEPIEEVIYSPHLFRSEAKAIAKFVGSRINQTQKWRQRISDLLSPGDNSDPSSGQGLSRIVRVTPRVSRKLYANNNRRIWREILHGPLGSFGT
jgi:hypothetical protein